MPKGYWIANVDVHDAEVYDKYRAANAKPFADFGAKFLVRGACLLYTSPSPRDLSTSRMPSSA